MDLLVYDYFQIPCFRNDYVQEYTSGVFKMVTYHYRPKYDPYQNAGMQIICHYSPDDKSGSISLGCGIRRVSCHVVESFRNLSNADVDRLAKELCDKVYANFNEYRLLEAKVVNKCKNYIKV